MKIVVFDLDETLGYFTQYGIFWDSLTNYLKEQNKNKLSQSDFDEIWFTWPQLVNVFGVGFFCLCSSGCIQLYPPRKS